MNEVTPHLMSDESEVEVRFTIQTNEAEDAHDFLIRVQRVSEQKHLDSYIGRILQAVADAIAEGLHVKIGDKPPSMMEDVEQFHQLFGLEYLGKPRMLPEGLFNFRLRFDQEELDEFAEFQDKLVEAVKYYDDAVIVDALDKQLDALVDGIYVKLGTAYLQFGAARFHEAWRRVHTANMKKERAEADEDARSHRDTKFDVVKPEGWVAPCHKDLVEDHAHKIHRKEGELNPGYESDTQAVPMTKPE